MTTDLPLSLLIPNPTKAPKRSQLAPKNAKEFARWLGERLDIPPASIVIKAASDLNAPSRALMEANQAVVRAVNGGERVGPMVAVFRIYNDDAKEQHAIGQSIISQYVKYPSAALAVLVIGGKAGTNPVVDRIAAADGHEALGRKAIEVLRPRNAELFRLAATSSKTQRDSSPKSVSRQVKGFQQLSDQKQAELVRVWRRTMCLVLEGAPGVGKSFIAEQLALQLPDPPTEPIVKRVQFHPSSSYEEFVGGWRPSKGHFARKHGTLRSFAAQAFQTLERPHVLIVDEINRGNLAKVFGEALSLIEPSKRCAEFAIHMSGDRRDAPPFFLPPNLYLLGMMNTADRSLAVVDFAVRRRFAFQRLRSAIGDANFIEYITSNGVPGETAERLARSYSALNARLGADPSLGPGFEIGHAYFCTPLHGDSPSDWYRSIFETQIDPLLMEYAADDPAQLEGWRALIAPENIFNPSPETSG